ncbi:L,D-transpeptidase [Nereida sp. MMG025]|uniref:L,D-transpeptidase n=1 Tax=Nereida sp. MMG025 TaxID=2909981 RepID=UPI001F36AC17|nr:L,D-transpeptidase [Nereida sp. MMG025]MCF6444825.1 L,D-transpeptidase [Nereida sp. MMG025]
MHLSRRRAITGAAASIAIGTPLIASASNLPPLPQQFRPRLVKVRDTLRVGDIHVVNDAHFLYHVTAKGQAVRYGVALGELGRRFRGPGLVTHKKKWPSWRPTPNMIRLEPALYGPYRDGLPGGHPKNPMGSAALYLSVNGRATYFRIHGTHLPHTIGTSFSSGCIRLRNDHMLQLYDAVPASGTRVIVHA